MSRLASAEIRLLPLAIGLLVAWSNWSIAADTAAPTGPADQTVVGRQPADEVPTPLVPAQPWTEEELAAIEAKKQFIRGAMFHQRNQLLQAREAFEQALTQDPNSLATLRVLAELTDKLERGKDAMEYARRALAIEPDDYNLLHILGVRTAEAGNIDEAVEALEKARAIPALRQQQGDRFFEVCRQLVQWHSDRKDYAAMAAALRDMIAVAEDPQKYNVDEYTRRGFDESRKVTYYEYLGQALTHARKYDEAVAVLEEARKKYDRGSRLSLPLAQVYFDREEYEKALKEVQAYLSLQIQNEEALTLLSSTLEKLDRNKELLDILADESSRDPHNPVLRRFYGQKLLEAGDYAKAEEQLLAIANRIETVPALGELYRKTKQPEKLLDLLTSSLSNPRGPELVGAQLSALAEEPELIEQMAQSVRDKIAAKQEVTIYTKYLIARGALAARLPDLCIEFYEMCSQERPDKSSYRQELAEALWSMEEYDKLVALCRKELEAHPDSFEFHNYLARSLEMQGKTDEAAGVIKTFLEKNEQPALAMEAKLTLAWIYQNARRYDDAIGVCRQLIEEHPKDNRSLAIRYMLAGIYTLKGDLSGAEEELMQLVAIDPRENPEAEPVWAAANNDLGYIWADDGRNLDKAEEMVRNALAYKPDSSAYLDSMGWVLFRRGDYEQAVEYLLKATAAEQGQDGVIFDHLGDAYLQLDQRDKAKEAWTRAVELMGDNPREKEGAKIKEIRRKLEFLEQPSSAAKQP